ncbi:uroporphyrinogen-III synthase [Paracoccaceae bacterium]
MGMVRQSRAQSLPPTILLTRPLPQSQRFARALAEICDLPVAISPLMAARALEPILPQRPFSAVILTSETGAELAGQMRGLPRLAYCVGDRTAAIAAEQGFQAVSAEGDAQRLAALIVARNDAGPLLHLRGADSRGNLAKTLTKGGTVTDETVIYDQQPQRMTAEARALIASGQPLIVPLFSPRSARLFRQEAGQPAGPLWLAALSPAVAEELAPLAADGLEIAERPDARAMLVAVQRLIASACSAGPSTP